VVEIYDEIDPIRYPRRLAEDDDVLYNFEIYKRKLEGQVIMQAKKKRANKRVMRKRSRSSSNKKSRSMSRHRSNSRSASRNRKRQRRGSVSRQRSRSKSKTRHFQEFEEDRANYGRKQQEIIGNVETLSVVELSGAEYMTIVGEEEEHYDRREEADRMTNFAEEDNFDTKSVVSKTDTIVLGDLMNTAFEPVMSAVQSKFVTPVVDKVKPTIRKGLMMNMEDVAVDKENVCKIFNNIQRGIQKGAVSWRDLKFSKTHVNFLNQHKQLMTQDFI
jgi:hypothetical protein